MDDRCHTDVHIGSCPLNPLGCILPETLGGKNGLQVGSGLTEADIRFVFRGNWSQATDMTRTE